MGFLAIVRLLLQLFPLILDAVKAAEAAFPSQGAGASKLHSVLSVLESAHTAAPDVAQSFDEIRAPATQLINGIVAARNQLKAAVDADRAP